MSSSTSEASRLTAEEEQQIEAELLKLEPPLAPPEPLRRVVLIDGLPETGASKAEKLTKVLRKKATAHAPVVKDGVQLELKEDGSTAGYAFVEFETIAGAEKAARKLNNLQLDKKHTLRANVFTDLDTLENLPEEFEEPAELDVVVKENMQHWLQDPRAVDQYVIRFGARTEVYWNAQKGTSKAELDYGRENWSETFVLWSPLGTYLATMHRQGVALWGGPSWKRIIRFQHPSVEVVEFSPCENYLITFSPQFVEKDDPKDPKAIIVWDIRTGRKLRGFVNGITPFFWSHDDRFVARLGKDVVSVYETPSMGLHQKQSLKVHGVRSFAWSPGANVLAYFVPEMGTRAARVVLVEFPSRKIIRQKNLFNVAGAALHWQSNGHYLCVKVDRLSKSRKTSYTNFELFRMKEKDIPIDVLEKKERIVAFAWEPRGKRFAIIHGEGARADVSFYACEKTGPKFLVTLDKRPANSIIWSPNGNHVVLAGMRNLNGQLEFYDVDKQETMAVDEHFMASTVAWDPTGRYVVTVVSAWRQHLETGMNLYSFHGEKIHSVLKDQFYQLLWRPRPPTLLTSKKEQHILSNLDKYIESILESDKADAERVLLDDRAERVKTREAFAGFVKTAMDAYNAAREQRIASYGFDPDVIDKDDIVATEQVVEETIDETEEFLD